MIRGLLQTLDLQNAFGPFPSAIQLGCVIKSTMLPPAETFGTPGARFCSWRSTASLARCTQVQSRLPFKGCTQISRRCRPFQGPRYPCAATLAYFTVAPGPVTFGSTPGQAGTVLSAHADELCTTTSHLSVTYLPLESF